MSTPANAAALQSALRAHQANRLSEAESKYRQLLRRDPGNLDAQYLLGVLLHHSGRSLEAVEPLQRAVAMAPTRAEFLNTLGDVHRVLGQYAEARVLFERALASRAGFAEAQHNLALTLNADGRTGDALVLLFTAVAAQPAQESLRYLLASMLQGVGLQSGNEVVRQVLRLLITDPHVNAQSIAGAVLGLVAAELDLPALMQVPTTAAERAATDRALLAVWSHELLRSALPRVIVTDVPLERALTEVRSHMLQAWHTGTGTDAMWVFAGALAAQCFNTEYAWMVDERDGPLLEEVRARLARALDDETRTTELLRPLVLLSALFSPLHAIAEAERLREMPTDHWDDVVRPLIETQLNDVAEERRLARAMDVLSPIHDEVSSAVREMYEDNPYPRWVMVPQTRAVSLDAFIRSVRPTASATTEISVNRRVLVAGCGSGQQPVQLARTHPDASILAIDLSRASLAYGARMAARLGVSTVQFAQADLLEFEPRDAPFMMISCSGVLHHLRDPLDGWRRLRAWLAPGGVMKIGLYSTLARASVEAARSVIRETGLAPDAAGLRAARRVILALPAAHPARGILAFADFFSLSGFRDLVMHVQERTYTIPELAEAMATLRLQFLGFQLPQPVQARFQAEQGSHALLDLTAWEQFEQAHPDTFASMYQFWCAPSD